MLFRFEGVVPGFGFREDGVTSLTFAFADRRISVVLRSERGDNAWNLHCESTTEVEPKPEVREAFESLDANRMPGSSRSRGTYPKPFANIHPSSMPEAFQQFAKGIRRELTAAAERAVGLLRWRAAELGPVRPFDSTAAVLWSFGDGEWDEFPSPTGASVAAYTGLEL
jgi:hypothetical protein